MDFNYFDNDISIICVKYIIITECDKLRKISLAELQIILNT